MLRMINLILKTGSVDDDPNEISNSHSIDDSDNGSGASITHKHGQTNSEYSDLNMDEKLNALLAFVDLLRAGQYINGDVQPVDSSAVISVIQEKGGEKDVTSVEDVDDLHPMQSIYLGSDRIDQLVISFDLEQKYAIHVATCRDDSDPDMFPKHKILSSQLQSLKATTYTLEVSYC
ncbi:hypothetical protein Tco_0642670 [Tanacetum coccineum]